MFLVCDLATTDYRLVDGTKNSSGVEGRAKIALRVRERDCLTSKSHY